MDAGFDITAMEAEVRGELVAVDADGNGRPAIRIAQADQTIFLVAVKDDEETPKHLPKLEKWLGEKPPVRFVVRGRLHGHPDGAVAMGVKSFERIVEETTKRAK